MKIEHVFLFASFVTPTLYNQEWDFPGEYFYNTDTQMLYLNYNGTGTPPNDDVVATNLKVVHRINYSTVLKLAFLINYCTSE